MQTLIICGHPHLDQSNANRAILAETARLLPGVEIRELGNLYPDGRIDVAAEQAALTRTDTVVLQFPIYWYGAPALLKQWIDDVFTYGFAYGSTGKALHGKRLILSFTFGAGEDDYSGADNFSAEDFLPPFRATSDLCGFDWQPPVMSYAMMNPDAAKVADHAARLVAQVKN
jgi:putative glutathione-regulated potassium-efflux system ancillary protein kefF